LRFAICEIRRAQIVFKSKVKNRKLEILNMGWIKRNKFFVCGCILALGLLGAAGFYDYQSWNRNAAAFDKLTEIYGTLRDLTSKKPSPGDDRVDNIAAAREQERQLRAWIRQARNYFQPIERIPDANNGSLQPEEFANGLSLTIDQLQHDAASANVTLPPDYGFSFTAERNRMTFASGSLDLLAAQLGEVKTISEILFGARINSLDSVQRVRVSDDDAAGPQSDYIDENSQTNYTGNSMDEMAVITPYQITFRAFSPEIAQVLSDFASSPHAFIVKGINVQRAEGNAAAPGSETPPPAMPAGRGGLQTVLNEQLLRVTIEIEIVKLSQSN
jgi:hypothetical protein